MTASSIIIYLSSSSQLLGVECTDIDVVVFNADFFVFAKHLKAEAKLNRFDFESDSNPQASDAIGKKEEGIIAEEAMKIMEANRERGKPVALVTVRVGDYHLDIMNGRCCDCGHPMCMQQSARDPVRTDCFLRDFTINSMFYNVKTKEIEDYAGGKDDLHLKRIRCPPLLCSESMLSHASLTGARYREYSSLLTHLLSTLDIPPAAVKKNLMFFPLSAGHDDDLPFSDDRVLSSLSRLSEDPIRVLRALRFSICFGFDVCEGILVVSYESDSVRAQLQSQSYRQRIVKEIDKLLSLDASSTWYSLILLDLPPVLFPPMTSPNSSHSILPESSISPHRSPAHFLSPHWTMDSYVLVSYLFHGISFFFKSSGHSSMKEINEICGEDIFVPYKSAMILPLLWVPLHEKLTSSSSPNISSSKVLTRAYLKEKWMWTKRTANLAVDLIEWSVEIHAMATATHPQLLSPPPTHMSKFSSTSLLYVIFGRLILSSQGMWRVAAELAILVERFLGNSAHRTESLLQEVAAHFTSSESLQFRGIIYSKSPFWSGNELKNTFHLTNGSQIRVLLNMVEDWRLANPVGSKDDCLLWLNEVLQNRNLIFAV
jgi:hypothetical protein